MAGIKEKDGSFPWLDFEIGDHRFGSGKRVSVDFSAELNQIRTRSGTRKPRRGSR
ncbi:hypothetical protein COLO4_32028 [Corchorus olitorius]|uniref:Uncharacterized protein n=1 Tax=Corchorus olitorius TaxID=93759 RepID=A0A1R3H2D6_9ROSI|nr:hypothetical protein COLO4_32028 [Corchorus olitorius]